ncbi:unnamed protein product [Lactuca virosa]|uniref:Uncharacterized protein n=1 Tax=Lactuca virosa TaxID=75947 RepID=A0AAU9LG21_9ASTR|nr:unnamed protein product [Lactuca virosa]
MCPSLGLIGRIQYKCLNDNMRFEGELLYRRDDVEMTAVHHLHHKIKRRLTLLPPRLLVFSQERDTSVKWFSCLPPVNHTREAVSFCANPQGKAPKNPVVPLMVQMVTRIPKGHKHNKVSKTQLKDQYFNILLTHVQILALLSPCGHGGSPAVTPGHESKPHVCSGD